jgi:tetratricopeptide (TPR) repeat protein
MSSLTPTPTPTPFPLTRADEVTQPTGYAANSGAGATGGVRRGIERSPAQWEAEALATAEEADSREGLAEGALRYASARMLADGVGDTAAAIDHLQLALATPPALTFRPALRALRLHALEAGSFWAAAEMLDIEIGGAASVAERADLLLEKGYLFEDRLLASGPARQAIEEALGLQPAHRGALAALQEIAERTADASLLRTALERRLTGASDPGERARVLAGLGLLAEADPARGAEALVLYGQALDEDATRGAGAVARAGLRRVAARLGNDVELLRGIALEADAVAGGRGRALWLAAAAALTRYRLGAVERAAALVERARAEDPDDPALLGAVAEDHLAGGRWLAARAAVDHEAELTTDRDWGAALLGFAAHIAEQHEGQDEAAAARYRRVLEVRRTDQVALHALERIASRTGDASAQVALAVAAVARADDPAERAALALRAAELAETASHDLTQAATLARRALDAVPGYAPALHLLERLYPALGRWSELVSVVESESEAAAGAPAGVDAAAAAEALPGGATAEDASRRLERLGTLYEERLGDPGKALTLFGEWSALGVRRLAALRALLRAAEKAGDALVAAEAALKLGTEVEEMPDEVRVAWRYRAATLYEERAAADDEAIRAYEAVLALAPGFRPARAGLVRAHYRRKRWEALTAALAEQAACEPNPAHGSALEVEAARIEAWKLGRIDRALESVNRALTLDPSNVAAIAEHARVLARLGRGDELAAALGSLAQAIADPAGKAAAYRRQAEVLEWQLGRPREALVAIERALATARTGAKSVQISAQMSEPASGETPGAPALASGIAAAELAQERLFQLLERSAEVAALQHKRLAGSSAPSGDAPAPHGRRIDLACRLADPEQALGVLAGVLDDAPGDAMALEIEVALLRRVDRDREAASALERLADSADEPEVKAALWRGAVAARERAGARVGETLPLWEWIVDARPTDDALTVLERAAARRGDWARVILARRKLAESASGEAQGVTRAVYLWELGLAHQAAGDLRGADADFERATDADPTFLPALRALARLREALGEPRAAAELYAREGRLTKATARAAEAFRQAARLYANDVRDDQMAARCLEEVLGLEPDAEVDFQVLEVILRARGERERLAQVMRRRAAAGTAAQRRDRLLALAELLHERVPSDAAEVLAEAIELDPTSVPALLRLAEVQAELARPAEAVETFRRAIAASSDGTTVSSAWVRVGNIAERDLADVGQAVDAYRNALLGAPDDIRALGGLVRGLVRQRDYANAAATLRRLASVDPDRSARVGHWVALGDLLSGAAEDPEGAAGAFEQALALDPRHDGAMDRLDAILSDLDEPARLAAALGRYLEVSPRSATRRVRLAALFSGPLASPARAVDELRIVVAAAPEDVQTRAELARVLESAQRLGEAVTEHLVLLRSEPLRLESIRALRRLFDRTGERHRAGRATACLVALGATDLAEIRAVREARARWSSEPVGTVTGAEFDAAIRHPDERHPATALLAAMVEVLPRLYAMSLEDWGVTKADRLGPRSEDPLRALVARVASILGAGDGFDIYLARAAAAQVEIEATQPAALLVPPTLPTLPRQEAFLQLGRQLGRLRAGTHVAARVPGKDLGLLIAAGVRTLFPDYGRGALPEDRLNDVAQKIARALPRRHRRAFEQAALSFRDGGVFDSDRWRAGLVHTGHRAALVASGGDVLGAFEHIVRGDRRLAAAAALSTEELARAARGSAEVVEMMNFALSDELAGLNRRLGLD